MLETDRRVARRRMSVKGGCGVINLDDLREGAKYDIELRYHGPGLEESDDKVVAHDGLTYIHRYSWLWTAPELEHEETSPVYIYIFSAPGGAEGEYVFGVANTLTVLREA